MGELAQENQCVLQAAELEELRQQVWSYWTWSLALLWLGPSLYAALPPSLPPSSFLPSSFPLLPFSFLHFSLPPFLSFGLGMFTLCHWTLEE